jgi:hypothetical protein
MHACITGNSSAYKQVNKQSLIGSGETYSSDPTHRALMKVEEDLKNSFSALDQADLDTSSSSATF